MSLLDTEIFQRICNVTVGLPEKYRLQNAHYQLNLGAMWQNQAVVEFALLQPSAN